MTGCGPRTFATLNEGRPFRAGNPLARVLDDNRQLIRSTKAGPSGPATLTYDVACRAAGIGAQRRPALPGRQPWLVHPLWWAVLVAQRRPALPGRQPPGFMVYAVRLPNRSTKAGPSGPATPDSNSYTFHGACSLNEGRPFRAGNPRPQTGRWSRWCPRSTKAGPSGPATPVTQVTKHLGDFDAQRRPALPGRQPRPAVGIVPLRWRGRSTKASPSGPATPWLTRPRRCRIAARSTKAGPSGPATPPARLASSTWTCTSAQRRPALPGRQPHKQR